MTITADILNESCDSLAAWTEENTGTGDVSVSPADQFLYSAPSGGNIAKAYVAVPAAPSQFTIEIETICDNVGGAQYDSEFAALHYNRNTWFFGACFGSDGLFIYDTDGRTEVGANLVVVNPAVSQVWRFQIDRSGGDASATVEVFLDGVSKGTVASNQEGSGFGYSISYAQNGWTGNRSSHVKYFKVGTGLGEFASGTIYEKDVDDILNVSDSPSCAQTSNKAKSDSITIGDSSSKTENKSKGDSITIGDFSSKIDNKAKSDSIIVEEFLLKSDNKNVSESLLMEDSFIYEKGLIIGIADLLVAADDLFKQDNKSVSNSITIGDVLLKSIEKNKDDSLNIDDSFAIGGAIGIDDSIMIEDPFFKVQTFNIIESDSIIITDLPTDGYELYEDDSVSVSDSFSKWKTPVLLSISIINLETDMSVGVAQQLKAIGYYDDDSEVDLTYSVTWTSSNEDVATIDLTGLIITSIAQGISFITAYLDTVYGRISRTLMIRVGMEANAVSSLTAEDIANLQLIPLDPSPNQTFNVVLTVDGRNINIRFQLRWNIPAQYWVMTLIDADVGDYLVDGIPLTTGVSPTINLLQPYSYLGIGSCYIINVSGIKNDYPDEFNLGTDYVMLWGNTEV